MKLIHIKLGQRKGNGWGREMLRKRREDKDKNRETNMGKIVKI